MNNTVLDLKTPMTPRYKSYKYSGIAWLGEVPKHWEVKRLKKLVKGSLVNGLFKKKESYGSGTLLVNVFDIYRDDFLVEPTLLNRVEIDNKEAEAYKVEPGDIFFVRSSLKLEGVGRSACALEIAEPMVFECHLVRGRPNKKLLFPRYANYFLNSSALTNKLVSKANVVTMATIDQGKIQNLESLLPPLPEQQAIAAYLDDKTAKLDQLIANKREQITQLKTLRKVTIHDAVTKGLNPDAPMKDSGIAWLGEVPKHWEIKRLKTFLNNIEQGWSPQCENRPAEDNEWAVLKVGCVNGGVFSKKENKALPKDESPKKEYLINKGDILVSRANTRELLGGCCIVENEYPRLILCDKLYRLDIHTSQLNKRFFIHFMQTKMARYQIESKATGASDSMQNIAQSVLEEILMAVPTENEQQAIAAYLDDKTAKLDQLIANKCEQIMQLETLRKVTIHDAVTGKINVSGLEV